MDTAIVSAANVNVSEATREPCAKKVMHDFIYFRCSVVLFSILNKKKYLFKCTGHTLVCVCVCECASLSSHENLLHTFQMVCLGAQCIQCKTRKWMKIISNKLSWLKQQQPKKNSTHAHAFFSPFGWPLSPNDSDDNVLETMTNANKFMDYSAHMQNEHAWFFLLAFFAPFISSQYMNVSRVIVVDVVPPPLLLISGKFSFPFYYTVNKCSATREKKMRTQWKCKPIYS